MTCCSAAGCHTRCCRMKQGKANQSMLACLHPCVADWAPSLRTQAECPLASCDCSRPSYAYEAAAQHTMHFTRRKKFGRAEAQTSPASRIATSAAWPSAAAAAALPPCCCWSTARSSPAACAPAALIAYCCCTARAASSSLPTSPSRPATAWRGAGGAGGRGEGRVSDRGLAFGGSLRLSIAVRGTRSPRDQRAQLQPELQGSCLPQAAGPAPARAPVLRFCATSAARASLRALTPSRSRTVCCLRGRGEGAPEQGGRDGWLPGQGRLAAGEACVPRLHPSPQCA